MISNLYPISCLLITGSEHVNKTTFTRWEAKVISTKRAIKEFKHNNRIDCDVDETGFEKWLNYLGYFRKD